jgi:predicted restriction endonuclease
MIEPYPYETHSGGKQEAYDRDEHKCFFCENVRLQDSEELTHQDEEDKKTLTAAHIFVWKKDGGMYVPTNIMMICRYHHNMLDFGINCTPKQQQAMRELCYMYLTLTYMREIEDKEVTGAIKGKKKKRRH